MKYVTILIAAAMLVLGIDLSASATRPVPGVGQAVHPGTRASETVQRGSHVESAETTRLRAENARLKMERDFAKKVATWFAKDQP